MSDKHKIRHKIIGFEVKYRKSFSAQNNLTRQDYNCPGKKTIDALVNALILSVIVRIFSYNGVQ